MKLDKELKVKATMLGPDEYMSIIGCFQVVEDLITELTGELNIDGVTVKEKYNAMWVFTKTRVKFFKDLMWNEKFNVSCFISYKSLAKLNFDISARNLSNELMFYARVEACALDRTTGTIRKISSVGVDNSIQPETPTIDVAFSKFDCANLIKVESVKIRSTNIDMSNHTNNLEYLRFILNTYSVQELKNTPKEIEVVYASQSFENDCLDILKAHEQNKDVIILQKNEKPIIKCEILF